MTVPSPTSFVVKNGSKIRDMMLCGMPEPLSVTKISTVSPNLPILVDTEM